MPPHLPIPLLGLGALLVLAGCATPEGRIERNPGIASGLSPEDRASIRQGIVKLGYTEDMVFLAAGKPTRVQTRLDGDGKTTVWRYTARRWAPEAEAWPRRWGPWGQYPPYRDFSEEYDILRIEFRGGRVTVIEQVER